MKKLYISLFILTAVSQLFGEEKPEIYNQGKNAADGALDALKDRFYGNNYGNNIEFFMQQLADNMLKGFGNSLKEGGQLDDFMKEFGSAGRRGMNSTATELGDGMKDASKIVRKDMVASASEVSQGMTESIGVWGKEVGNSFKEGSEFDKGTKTFFDTNARNLNGFVNDIWHKNLIKSGGIFLGITGSLFVLRFGIPFAFEMIKRKLMRPKLIIESSKKNIIQKFTSLFSSAYKPLEMVFSVSLQKQLDEIVKVTKAINTAIGQGKVNVKYRNLMLYGPPGTGKTMFAKELARRSGLEYAFMSGSSFSKFKDGEGIEALDELFAWAKRSKGLMIFIDEAENFLSKRENMDPQSKAYQLLNNFLNYTGERSDRFMIVFATNHQEALDSAMYRRIDDLIEMPLPSKAQRIGALNLYKNKILMNQKQNGKSFVNSANSCLDAAMIESIAERIKGLSYGDIEGIINTLRTDSIIQDPAIITTGLVDAVVERAIKKHHVFTNGQLLGAIED